MYVHHVTLTASADENKENIAAMSSSTNAEVERELGEIKERLRLTESQLLDERNARNRITEQVRDHVTVSNDRTGRYSVSICLYCSCDVLAC